MDYGILNVRTNVITCDCARGCMDIVRESALKADSGRKIPCRTRESNLRRRRTGPMLYQLSYIPPTHTHTHMYTRYTHTHIQDTHTHAHAHTHTYTHTNQGSFKKTV